MVMEKLGESSRHRWGGNKVVNVALPESGWASGNPCSTNITSAPKLCSVYPSLEEFEKSEGQYYSEKPDQGSLAWWSGRLTS